MKTGILPICVIQELPSPESRGTDSAGGTLKRPAKVVQTNQSSAKNGVQISSSGGVFLQESYERYSRADELLKMLPRQQPIAPEALNVHQRPAALGRDPNGGFPGDGQSVVSIAPSSSRQRRKLDPSVEEQLKGSIQLMLRTQTKKEHSSRASHRHRPSGGSGGHGKEPEHNGSTDHAHIVHEHRHIHEHYFTGHAPDGIALSPRQTTEDSRRVSWHHEYSVSHDHCSSHEKTSEQTIYRVSEKLSHGRERPTSGMESSRQ